MCTGVTMSKTPITEASNSITQDIDVASPVDIVRLLHRCDKEIFSGYQQYKSLFHEDILKTIENVAGHVQAVLETPDEGLVVFSGCGTSGRLAFLVSRTFNELLAVSKKPKCFRYIIAGGDRALFTSQEAPEDDPVAGISALKQVSEGKKKVVFVGITCGLSAPYVAGQLEYCMDHSEIFTPVLIGFNPSHLARNIRIEKWDKTFIQVVRRLETSCQAGYLLNAVVGPEPITGSSRMKSGTATKILLETICMKAWCDVRNADAALCVQSYIECYRAICESVYKHCDVISHAVQMTGESLVSGGSIYYLGVDSLALVGLIDASECPPTYGASLDDVRGFVQSGYHTLQNDQGDMSNIGRHFRISLDNFADLLLAENDTVIVINAGDNENVLRPISGKKCKKVLLTFTECKAAIFDHVISFESPTSAFEELIGRDALSLASQMFREIAVKWCLNALSTGAHILKGKVYRNIMIDVKVSNNKLFHRAVGILQRVSGKTEAEAVDGLLRSIYDTDVVTDQIRSKSVADHIEVATPKDKVVPAALVAMVTGTTIENAKIALSREPVIRTAIVKALGTQQ